MINANSMNDALKAMMTDATVGDFLFPSVPSPIKGMVTKLTTDIVVVESSADGKTYEYITHPNNVVVVQEKS